LYGDTHWYKYQLKHSNNMSTSFQNYLHACTYTYTYTHTHTHTNIHMLCIKVFIYHYQIYHTHKHTHTHIHTYVYTFVCIKISTYHYIMAYSSTPNQFNYLPFNQLQYWNTLLYRGFKKGIKHMSTIKAIYKM